jgi:excisionase family DNA binding protein
MPTPNNPLPALDAAQRYTVNEALAYLRTSRATLYKLIASGQLRVIKQGKRTFCPGAEIAKLSRVPA